MKRLQLFSILSMVLATGACDPESAGSMDDTPSSNESGKADAFVGPLFHDLDPEHPAYGEIQTAVSRGWVAGFPDGTFRPDQEITRAQYAALVIAPMDRRALELTLPTALPSFSDVPEDHWASEVVGVASELGLMAGYDDGSFRPAEPITRQEAWSVMARLLAERSSEGRGAYAFSDFIDGDDVSDWARENVAIALHHQVPGTPALLEFYDETDEASLELRPTASTNRAEAVSFMFWTLRAIAPEIQVELASSECSWHRNKDCNRRACRLYGAC